MLEGWSPVTIHGHSADVFTPAADDPKIALLYLHPVGKESLAVDRVFTELLQELGFACCVPHGEQSWWADRICPEFDTILTAEQWLLQHVQPWMKQFWNLSDNAIALAGISMGGQGAIRLGFKYPHVFRAVGSIAGAFEYHRWYGQGTPIDEMYRSKEACRQDTAILHIHGSQYPPNIWLACDPQDDPWLTGNDRLVEKMNALGIEHTADLETQCGGHTWDYFHLQARPMLEYLKNALEKQKFRLM